MPNVREIVVAYLKKHGYDGLCTDDCGCGLDDLAPCGECMDLCVPGYKRPAEDDDYDFIITPEKQQGAGT